MGSKIEARRLMQSAGVPVVPGETPDDQSDTGIVAAARRIGLPALIKASAGGGGKGMRIAREARELAESVAAARREALAAFADGTLYVERLIEQARHIEVQIVADRHGQCVHLFERDCSVQRRHQKVIEESPSPVVSPSLRGELGAAAVAAARAAGYENAGTIEFLMAREQHGDAFYFLEMNTRLQVEHPVTEAVTGVDLVRAQLRIAAGERLPWSQEALALRGHAIEARVYAEDPDDGFLPQSGPLILYREPTGPGIRVDSGVREGTDMPVHYDPLMAKVIAHAEDRTSCLARLEAALARFAVLGVRTNVAFLIRVLAHPGFQSGIFDTGFLDGHRDELTAPGDAASIAAAVATAGWLARGGIRPDEPHGQPRVPDPWDTLTGWRS
jgi:acetyl/propionyl-CoA carboxylase alpha subunit